MMRFSKLGRALRRLSACLVPLLLVAACGGTAATPAADSAGGTPLVDVVQLDTAAVRLGGILVGRADTVSTIELPVTGTITFDANRVSHVGSRTEGRVVELRADLGRRVAKGDVLVELESPEVGQIRADEQEAEALVKIARENFEREQRLESMGISSRKERLDAEADLRRAEAALKSAADRLRVLGAGHGDGGHFDLLAPFAGAVVARNVSVGQMASQTDTLLTIADLARVWIELDIYERNLAQVRPGQRVDVTVEAYAERTFPGRIVYLGAVLDAARRTVRARVEIPNSDGALKPGMFATARIAIPSSTGPLVVVPEDAVQEMEGALKVFVPGEKAGEFRAIEVSIGERLADRRVVITRGLTAGQPVVVAGAFGLRSELARTELTSGEH